MIVDDDPDTRQLICLHIEESGMRALEARSGSQAIQVLHCEQVDLIVLDLMMPDQSGIDVLKFMRDASLQTLVIVVSAKRTETDKVTVLDLGADDYMTKPFSPRELVARVKANLRRFGKHVFADEHKIRAGSLVLDTENLVLHKGERIIRLTPIECSILALFMRHPDRVHTKAEISMSVWNHNQYDSNTISVYINQLRKKVEDDPSNPVHIQTVWGIGYRFAWGPP